MLNALTNRLVAPRVRPARSGVLGHAVRLVLRGHEKGQRPSPPMAAVAVLGRSNVGKSSLLNALLGVSVARVSQTPGRTQALFWYRVDDRFDLVDCPGYGFAKASSEDRSRFAGLIEDLITATPGLFGAVLLVDGRLEPQDADRSMALFLAQASVPTVIAATKWDVVKPSQRVRRLRELADEYASADRPLQPVSSRTGEHLAALARLVTALAAPRHQVGPPNLSAKES